MSCKPGDVLIGLCSTAKVLVIAAPYIKIDALTAILRDVKTTISLICITRWKPYDFTVGASDAECRTAIIERGGSFRLHPSLHAKYYRMDDVVLIGSANLTFPAMGWSAHSNLEILCPPGHDFDSRAFENHLLKDAREIDDCEFERWASITRIPNANQSSKDVHQPSLDTWRPATRDPKHLELAYEDRMDDIAAPDEQATAQRDIAVLAFPPDLSLEQLRTWASTCLLASPFTNSVIQLHGMDSSDRARALAEVYGLGLTEARRDMETVENWLAYLAPETLPQII